MKSWGTKVRVLFFDSKFEMLNRHPDGNVK